MDRMHTFCRHAGLAMAGLILLLWTAATPAQAQPGLTQHDWMLTLVDALGWSFGLPDEPTDQDYIDILLGKRSYRFEAEKVYTPEEDEVAIMAYENFGPFSGESWLQSVRKTTPLHLRFTLPIAGDYALRVAVRGQGHEIRFGDQSFKVDGGESFSSVPVGTLTMPAGAQELLVTIPSNGAIDYLELSATNLPMIVPAAGWQPEAPLTWEAVNTSLTQVFDLAELLPVAGEPIRIEAETLPLPQTAHIVRESHLGPVSNGRWLRNGALPAAVEVPLAIDRGGFFTLELRAMGGTIGLTFNDHRAMTLETKAYLDDYRLPPFFLPGGDNRLVIDLPSRGGIDLLTLQALQSDAPATARVLGLPAPTGAPTPTDLNLLSNLLAAFGAQR